MFVSRISSIEYQRIVFGYERAIAPCVKRTMLFDGACRIGYDGKTAQMVGMHVIHFVFEGCRSFELLYVHAARYVIQMCHRVVLGYTFIIAGKDNAFFDITIFF